MDDIKDEGAAAYAAGLTLDDNPYSDNSPNGVAWREAWRAAEQAAAPQAEG